MLTIFSRTSLFVRDVVITRGVSDVADVAGDEAGVFLEVLRRFWRISLRCALTVAGNLPSYFSTIYVVIPGHDVKNLVLITLIHVDLIGLNAALCRYVAMSCFSCIHPRCWSEDRIFWTLVCVVFGLSDMSIVHIHVVLLL